MGSGASVTEAQSHTNISEPPPTTIRDRGGAEERRQEPEGEVDFDNALSRPGGGGGVTPAARASSPETQEDTKVTPFQEPDTVTVASQSAEPKPETCTASSQSAEPRPETHAASSQSAEPRPETHAAAVQSTEPKPDAHAVDIQSSSSSISEKDEVEELLELLDHPTVLEPIIENEEAPLAFESFLHNSGTLYSCFSQHGNRVYVDESQNLQPFPNEWYSQGRFITGTNEVSYQTQAAASSQQVTSESLVSEDDRASGVYIQGKGNVMTYMFEEKANICRYFDAQTGLWLLLPLQWEMNIEFVKARVKRVTETLPGLVDQKEITAALRQCNYDPDEVISVYLTIFGDILLQRSSSPGDHGYKDLNSFRAHLEKDRVIEDLRQRLSVKEKEAETLSQRNVYMAREAHYMSDVIQHLNHRVAELEADQQEAKEKIRALLSRRAVPPVPPPRYPKPGPSSPAQPAQPAQPACPPAPSPDKLRQISQLTRGLNVCTKQLRSTVRQTIKDMQNHLEQLKGALSEVGRVEERAAGAAEELRSLYRKEALERKSLYNKLLELQGNIRVFCRCRGGKPPASGCLETTSSSEQEMAVVHKGGKKMFEFDKVYPPSASQEEVFEGTLPIITSCVDGYNVCILAYGQTGSGKTYTMMGTGDNPGVNIRSVRELVRICAEKEKLTYTLKISMLEIYNDGLNDLLTKTPSGGALDIRAQGKSISVPGLTQVEVSTEADIVTVMETGQKNRKIASTKMNIESSRSHLVVTLTVEGLDSVSGVTSRGTLTLCDLAGSERISKTEAKGQRLVEAAAINKSLTALGQVFSALRCNALHVPFRNSKLTHLLQPCLSGDAKCCVFVNVSPDENNVAETLSTLQFGSTIRQVTLGKTTQNLTTPGKTTQNLTTPAKSSKPDPVTPAKSSKPEDVNPAKSPRTENVTPAKNTKTDSVTPAKSSKPDTVTPAKSTKPEDATPAKSPRTDNVTPAKNTKTDSVTPAKTLKPESVTPAKSSKPDTPTPAKSTKPDAVTPAKSTKTEK